MAIADTNSIIRAYLVTCATLTALVTNADTTFGIYSPRLKADAELPAVSFFTRGGISTPYIPGLPEPSVQFDCWADNLADAREVYRALYDNLQGIQNITVGSYKILGAQEEVQGQDLVDVEIPNYFRVLTFFSFMIKAE